MQSMKERFDRQPLTGIVHLDDARGVKVRCRLNCHRKTSCSAPYLVAVITNDEGLPISMQLNWVTELLTMKSTAGCIKI